MKTRLSAFKRKIKASSLIDSFKFVRANSPLIYYWDYEQNWGDSINEFIFESILEKKIYCANRIFNFKNKEVITGIGSVLNSRLKNYSIWGSGFLSEKHTLTYPPNKILALRGMLTHNKILKLFGKKTEMFGDPGLIFKEFYFPKLGKEYQLGIIPHFKELNDKIILDIQVKFGPDIKIISPTLDIFEFADEVSKCENILSSSLHGLVLAESYGIPTSRINISNKLIGGDFKFADYYSGVQISFDHIGTYNLQEHFDRNSIFSIPLSTKDLKYDSKGIIDSLKFILAE